MADNKFIQREFESDFSKYSQPVWFRILKYILFACMLHFFWGSIWIWMTLPAMMALTLLLHFWYKYKTHRWTRSYDLWRQDEAKAITNNK